MPCRGPLPSSSLLSGQELSWLLAALYNVGVDLYSDGKFEAATAPLLAAASASICSLAEAVLEGSSEQVRHENKDARLLNCSILAFCIACAPIESRAA